LKPDTTAFNSVIHYECSSDEYEVMNKFSGVWLKDFSYIGQYEFGKVTLNMVGQKDLKVNKSMIDCFMKQLRSRIVRTPCSININCVVIHDNNININSIESGTNFLCLSYDLIISERKWNIDKGNFSNLFVQMNLHILRMYLSVNHSIPLLRLPRYFAPLAHIPIYSNRVAPVNENHEERSIFIDKDENLLVFLFWISLLSANDRNNIKFSLAIPLTNFCIKISSEEHSGSSVIGCSQPVLWIWNLMRRLEFYYSYNGVKQIICETSTFIDHNEFFNQEILMNDLVAGLVDNILQEKWTSISDAFAIPSRFEVVSESNSNFFRVKCVPWMEALTYSCDWQELEMPIELSIYDYVNISMSENDLSSTPYTQTPTKANLNRE